MHNGRMQVKTSGLIALTVLVFTSVSSVGIFGSATSGWKQRVHQSQFLGNATAGGQKIE